MTPSRRLGALFLVALLGVVAALGAVVLAVAGAWVLAGYVLVVVALLAVGAGWARGRAEPARPEGRTCTCCTSTVHDPVEVR